MNTTPTNLDTLSDQHLLFAEWHTHVANLLLVKGALDKLDASPPLLPAALVAGGGGLDFTIPTTPPATPKPPAMPSVVKPVEPAKKAPAKKQHSTRGKQKKPSSVPRAGSNLRGVYDALDEVPRSSVSIATRADTVPEKQVSSGLICLHKRGLISRHNHLDGRRYAHWTRPGGADTVGTPAKTAPSPKGGPGGATAKSSPR